SARLPALAATAGGRRKQTSHSYGPVPATRSRTGPRRARGARPASGCWPSKSSRDEVREKPFLSFAPISARARTPLCVLKLKGKCHETRRSVSKQVREMRRLERKTARCRDRACPGRDAKKCERRRAAEGGALL